MATAAPPVPVSGDREWFIVGRWQEYEGEARTNLLRIVAIGAFYGVELINFHLLQTPDAAFVAYHQKVTALAVAWTMVALAILLCLRRRVFPALLKYVSAGCDLVLLTALASLPHGGAEASREGPFSPLVAIYFLIIALAGLRFSLGLVWFSTLGAMLGYLALIGLVDMKDSRWFDEKHAVPPVVTLITLLALGMTGIVVGQIVRRIKGMADEYAHRLSAAKGTA
ncbi:MAG TPA: hypothetical protein VFB96_18770 [Pirellulaceae bacterium]|nr:hypothetical protein [Pirellulaceae bacterium]